MIEVAVHYLSCCDGMCCEEEKEIEVEKQLIYMWATTRVATRIVASRWPRDDLTTASLPRIDAAMLVAAATFTLRLTEGHGGSRKVTERSRGASRKV